MVKVNNKDTRKTPGYISEFSDFHEITTCSTLVAHFSVYLSSALSYNYGFNISRIRWHWNGLATHDSVKLALIEVLSPYTFLILHVCPKHSSIQAFTLVIVKQISMIIPFCELTIEATLNVVVFPCIIKNIYQWLGELTYLIFIMFSYWNYSWQRKIFFNLFL